MDPTLITLLVGLVSGAVGSSILWLTIGKRIVANAVIKHATKGLMDFFKTAYDDQESEEAQQMGNMIQLGTAYALRAVIDLIPESPDEPAPPELNRLLKYFEYHVTRTLAANFGNLVQSLQGKIGDLTQGGLGALGGIMENFGGEKGTGAMGDIGSILSMVGSFQKSVGSPPPQPPSGPHPPGAYGGFNGGASSVQGWT